MTIILWGTSVVIVLQLAIATRTTEKGKVQLFVREDLAKRQWEMVSLQFSVWGGYWVRYNSSAEQTLASAVMRNFTFINSSAVYHTNVYDNPLVCPKEGCSHFRVWV